MIRLIVIAVMLITMASPALAKDDRGIAVRPVAPIGGEAKGDLWLLSIGIDSYLSWPRLKTATNDAKAVRNTLLSRYHLDKTHVIELLDDKATRHNILAAFRDLAMKVKPDDSLLVFYAGHGHIDPITGKGSWIPVESGTDDPSSWIDNRNITDYLSINAIKAKHVLLVSDSCFSGDFFRGNRGANTPTIDDAFLKKAYSRSSRQAISSGGLEPVSDAGFGGNSVFSHFLVAALQSNSKSYLIPSEIFGEIKSGVGRNADQLPQYGDLHNVGGQDGGELILFLKQENRLQEMGATSAAKQKELVQLKKMEQEAAAAKQREQAEIAKREQELATLDKQIADMKGRLGAGSARSGDSLDNIIALAEQKEAQGNRLEELRKLREEEEQKRQRELELLKKEAADKRVSQIKADLAKYQKVASSKYAQDMKGSAWDALLATYPEAKGVAAGDADAFLAALELAREGGEYITLAERRRKATVRPVIPLSVGEEVWKVIESSEAYRNMPRPRAIKVSSQYESQVEYTGSVSKTLPKPPPVQTTENIEVTPLNDKCSLSIYSVIKNYYFYSCGGYLPLGNTTDQKTTTITESIDELKGSLFPVMIGAQLSMRYKTANLLDRKYDTNVSSVCHVEDRSDARNLNPKLTGAAWSIRCQSSSKMNNNTHSSESVDYYLEDLGVFLSSIGQANFSEQGVTFFLPVPGFSSVSETKGDYGSRTTKVYSSYNWTVGE